MVQLCAAPYGDNMNLLVEVLVVMIAACTPIILTVIFLFYPRNRDVYEEELYGGDYNSAAAKTIYGTKQVNTVYRTNPVTMYGTNPMTTVYGTNPVNTLYGANPANAMYRPSPAYIPESGNTAYSSNAGNTMFKGSAPAQEADNKANTPDQDATGKYVDDAVPVSSAAWRPDPIWYLELTNIANGVRMGKRFRKELIMGRFIGTGEQPNMLYLDRSKTISRRHVKATVMDGGIAIENLSSVNVARLNGRALTYPEWIRYSDHLEIGDETYVVTGLSRVA